MAVLVIRLYVIVMVMKHALVILHIAGLILAVVTREFAIAMGIITILVLLDIVIAIVVVVIVVYVVVMVMMQAVQANVIVIHQMDA